MAKDVYPPEELDLGLHMVRERKNRHELSGCTIIHFPNNSLYSVKREKSVSCILA